jgi:1,2-diacylglycerol-3-alpha-glucose alpha-1,2-glucosyltransferase
MPNVVERPRRVILCPRDHLAYGQDFHNAGLMEHCGLTMLRKGVPRYEWSGRDPELIITQNPDDPSDADFIAGKGSSVPSVAHIHCRWEYFDDGQKEHIERTLANVVAGITPAEFHRAEMERLFPRVSWHVGANGVRSDLFRPATKRQRDEFRLTNLLSPDTKLVGFAGRIESAKGTEILKEIGKLIADQPFALFIQFPAWQAIRERVGTWERCKSLLQEIRDLCPRKVILWADTDPRFNNRPARFLDVFLCPSLSEVQPLVVLEALASGVPVVATDATPFYRELRDLLPASLRSSLQIAPLPARLRQGNTPRKSELQEAAGLAGALVELINTVDVSDYRQREMLASAILAAGFSESSMNARISAIYDQVVQAFDAGQRGLRAGETYPMTRIYVDHAPTEIGVVEYIRDGRVVHVADASFTGGLLSGLRAAMKSENDDERATHFRFETCDDPKQRLSELLAAYGFEDRRKQS